MRTESERNRSNVAQSIIKMMRNKAEFVQRGAEQYRSMIQIDLRNFLFGKTSRGEFRARGGRETSGSNRPMEHGLVNKDAETRPRNKFTTD